MKAKHTITDVEFHGNAHRGHLYYKADGVEVEIDGEFWIDSNGVGHHDHWFDEDGEDTMEVLF